MLAARTQHPLPDGNKRAVWTQTVFIELNGRARIAPIPDVDDTERMMLAVAERSVSEADSAEWLSTRVEFE